MLPQLRVSYHRTACAFTDSVDVLKNATKENDTTHLFPLLKKAKSKRISSSTVGAGCGLTAARIAAEECDVLRIEKRQEIAESM